MAKIIMVKYSYRLQNECGQRWKFLKLNLAKKLLIMVKMYVSSNKKCRLKAMKQPNNGFSYLCRL